ncbi:DUF2341 domain-containing protein, partial [Pseudomonas aeruginosa]
PDGTRLPLYVGAREVASLAAAVPAFSGAIAIGAEGQPAPAVATEAASGEGEASAAAPTLQPIQGASDELRLSKIARPA